MINISIKPLSRETLQETIALADLVFGSEQKWWEKASWAFQLSLKEGWLPKLVLRLVGIKQCNYWVAVDSNQNVLGVTGLYTQYNSPDAYWLGWFCITPAFSGKGIGGQLLTFAMDKARKSGVSYLKLYTLDSQNYKIARGMYERRGFVLTKQVKQRHKGNIYTTLYYELPLTVTKI